jgi:hydroxyacylglutathione hydrolase
MITVLHVPALKDNYIWLIVDADAVAIVDPGDARPVIAAVEDKKLRPIAILCTHHHNDHVGGVQELAQRYSIPVYGPAAGEKISGVTHALREGDRVTLGALNFEVLDIPGHTAGHIAYYGHDMLFCGDTLFSAGCGRLLGGTAAQLHLSLQRLTTLPETTAVYCGHEYTETNLRFALTVEPENADAQEHLVRVLDARRENRPSLPTTIGLEKRINPFLRTPFSTVRRTVEQRFELVLESPFELFATLRRWKDDFRG